MGMFAVKNDNDKYLFGHHQWGKPGQIVLTYSNATSAKCDAKTYGGRVVELIEAPAKVVVSQEEADMLEKAKHPTFRPSFMITEYSNSHKGYILGNDLEDRLMRAYVI